MHDVITEKSQMFNLFINKKTWLYLFTSLNVDFAQLALKIIGRSLSTVYKSRELKKVY